MKFFSYLNAFVNKGLGRTSSAQDAHLPLGIRFKSRLNFETPPFISAITHGALLNVDVENLKFLPITAISSLKMDGMENQKIHRFYFETPHAQYRQFLQILSAENNPEDIHEILFCSSATEPPESEEDIAFFLGENESGLGEPTYSFAREDLYFFLSENEIEKRLSPESDGVDYLRAEQQMEFMPALSGVETILFDENGRTGQRIEIKNFMPHSRLLAGKNFERLMIAFWVLTSENGRDIPLEDQFPVADYIFAIKLETANLTVI